MLNTFLAERLRTLNSPKILRFLVELPDVQVMNEAREQLAHLPGVSVVEEAFNYVVVAAPPGAIPLLEQVGVSVHYDMPRSVLTAPAIIDSLLGRFSGSGITIPYTPAEMLARNLRNAPLALAAIPSALGALVGLKGGPRILEPNVVMVPTAETRQLLAPPEDSIIRNTRVAVLDTGLTVPHPLVDPRSVRPLVRSTTGEPGVDGLGHGQWCTTAAFGGSAATRFGRVTGVATVVDDKLMHVKCLSNLGFGATSSVLKAMEIAVQWGARVISMSLGGPLQGSVDEDPESRIIRELRDTAIFVVAAGNSGPEAWTIGSPGASPFAVTVGAYSPVYEGLAIFSSRGPNAAWYEDHQAMWEQDLGTYGDNLVRPDCISPGGGPVENGQPTDVIYSGVTGWTNGMNDRSPIEPFDGMRGTSMATPHAAGIIALAVEHGLVSTAADVKARLNRLGTKDSLRGYGFLTYNLLAV